MRAISLHNPAGLLLACAVHAILLWLALSESRSAPFWHSVIWPPHAWVFSLMLLVPLAQWRWLIPGLVITEMVTHHLVIGTPWSGGLTFSLINLVQAGVPAFVLRQHHRHPFQHLRDLLLFLVLVLVLVSPWTSIAGCHTNSFFFGTACDMASASQWWITNAVSLITLAPAIVLIVGLPQSPERHRWQTRIAETVTVLIIALLLAQWIFQRSPDNNPLLVSYAYLGIPVLIWAALRMGPALTALGTLLITVISIQATHRGLGPFADTGISTDIAILSLQTFLGMMAGCSLLVSVLAEDLRQIERLHALQERNMELEGLLRHGSRQIRNHLSGIGRQGSILQQQLADPAPEVAAALSTLQDHRQHALNLLAALTQYVGLGKKPAQRMAVDMAQMLAHLRDEYEEELTRLPAHIELDELPSCLGNPEQLHEIFSQLLDHAIRYRAPGRTLHIRIKAERYEDHSTYIIEDNGRGISAEMQNDLWQLFHSGGTPLEDRIGLATARRLADLNHGTLRLASAPGLGSRFYITLPSVPRT